MKRGKATKATKKSYTDIGNIAIRLLGRHKVINIFKLSPDSPAEIIGRRLNKFLSSAVSEMNKAQKKNPEFLDKNGELLPEKTVVNAKLLVVLKRHKFKDYLTGKLLISFSPGRHLDGSNINKCSFDRIDNTIRDYTDYDNLAPTTWDNNRSKSIKTVDQVVEAAGNIYRYSAFKQGKVLLALPLDWVKKNKDLIVQSLIDGNNEEGLILI